MKSNIVEVTSSNIIDHPQAICFINPKHELYHVKVDWLNEQYDMGLRIKLLYLESEKRPVGFIEYIKGEHCWRAVNAKGYMFIHCLWTNGKKYQHQGLGQLLIQEAEKDAESMLGVTVVTSDKSFMTNSAIFLKCGYEITARSGKEQLLTKQFKKGTLPSINDWERRLKNYKGLNVIYSKQCPWVVRFIEDVKPILKKENLKAEFIEIKTASQAQNAPSLYSTFNLIYNGKLLADRYISTTRFLNIVNKEIKQ